MSDGWDGMDGMVLIGHGSSKSTFGGNNYLLIFLKITYLKCVIKGLLKGLGTCKMKKYLFGFDETLPGCARLYHVISSQDTPKNY